MTYVHSLPCTNTPKGGSMLLVVLRKPLIKRDKGDVSVCMYVYEIAHNRANACMLLIHTFSALSLQLKKLR